MRINFRFPQFIILSVCNGRGRKLSRPIEDLIQCFCALSSFETCVLIPPNPIRCQCQPDCKDSSQCKSGYLPGVNGPSPTWDINSHPQLLCNPHRPPYCTDTE